MKKNILNICKIFTLTAFTFLSISCSDEDPTETKKEKISIPYAPYYVGLQIKEDPAAEVLIGSNNLSKDNITPKNRGVAFPQYNTFFEESNAIFVTGGYPQTKFRKFESTSNKLVENGATFTTSPIYAKTKVDQNTMLMMSSPRKGLGAKVLYTINIKTMNIVSQKELNFGTLPYKVEIPKVGKVSLTSFPTDLIVKNGKLYISYFTKAEMDSFITPVANEAQIAVYSYPDLKFEKTITDSRIPNIGRYSSENVLEEDENGNIYTFATSSYMAGFYPVPQTNSGILKLKKGEDSFDKDFHIDFEKLSGGAKIFDLIYVANNKAVVRFFNEDESKATYKQDEGFFGAYALPIVKTGIINLETKTLTELDIPSSIGGFNTTSLKEGSKLHLGITTTEKTAYVYTIDVNTEKATKGATATGIITSLMKISK